ncbi:beta-carotene 15,15'-monooxygenase, Brp/Blh family [Jannaschia seosinensis]|uniref:Probable beta-carotene 15,15'-dioxygenase n=1 Tax=Jannaschia seosinensis TaxID=313367 RepID=A0A0M7BEE7_9RHOB|nr:Brp/Blh family beta-carotene 15,15'-dioxygenase [Jannaschia seosinensis]CUH39676.1 beta-carotene 15,15'-monooxygenase, Brp/Blh family [Jannaschia seosinensis]
MRDEVDLENTRRWAPVFAARHDRLILFLPLVALIAAPLLWRYEPAALAVPAAWLVWLGMPHGGADDAVAKPMMRPIFGRLWLPVFAGAYLLVSASVLVGVIFAPVVSVALFVTVAAVHFGLEDTNARWAGDSRRRDAVEVVAQGGVPFFLPLLLHPDRTGAFLSLLTGGVWPRAALTALGFVWLAAFAAFWGRRIYPLLARRDWVPLRAAAPVAALTLSFVFLPPLAAFTVYFLTVHVPRHTAELARRHAPTDRVRAWSFARRAGIAMTLLVLPLAFIAFVVLHGPPAERFVLVTFWGIWALTVPHMMLYCADRRWGNGRLG